MYTMLTKSVDKDVQTVKVFNSKNTAVLAFRNAYESAKRAVVLSLNGNVYLFVKENDSIVSIVVLNVKISAVDAIRFAVAYKHERTDVLTRLGF